MPRPPARAEESSFRIEELFFSRTDKRGVISAGNDVFVRVSEYARTDLVGKPHNLIRHPDMPKAVFRLFWEILESGKPVVAYVKNMSREGRYYWVLAAAFPIDGGYLSIRMKPTSDLFRAVEKIYAEVLAVEQKNGMDAAYAVLVEKIASAGFADYAAFMRTALSTELELRDRALSGAERSAAETGFSPEDHRIGEARRHCKVASVGFRSTFERILQSSRRAVEFRSTAERISRTYVQIHLLSTNMTIASEHLGLEGRSLAVTSETFSKWAGEIQKSVIEFGNALRSVTGTLETLEFALSTARAQIEMAEFFATEYLEKVARGDASRADFADLMENCSYFFLAPERLFADVEAHIASLSGNVRFFLSVTEDLRTSLNALKLIRQNAKIEVARLKSDSGSFRSHLDEMHAFIDEIQGSVGALNEAIQLLRTTVAETSRRMPEISREFRIAASIAEEASKAVA